MAQIALLPCKHLGATQLSLCWTILMGRDTHSSQRQTLVRDLWTDLALDVLDSNLYLYSCEKPEHAP